MPSWPQINILLFCHSRQHRHLAERSYDFFALLKLRFSLECGMWIKVIWLIYWTWSLAELRDKSRHAWSICGMRENSRNAGQSRKMRDRWQPYVARLNNQFTSRGWSKVRSGGNAGNRNTAVRYRGCRVWSWFWRVRQASEDDRLFRQLFDGNLGFCRMSRADARIEHGLSLYLIEHCMCRTSEQSVAVIDPRQDQCAHQGVTEVDRKRASDRSEYNCMIDIWGWLPYIVLDCSNIYVSEDVCSKRKRRNKT